MKHFIWILVILGSEHSTVTSLPQINQQQCEAHARFINDHAREFSAFCQEHP